ncbi:MAG TPA: hypothetical protein VKQ30_24515 [Ktedonobacterales bacterium]|nr:hypothetical protein [Ktedonobacterales bacterium]
MVANDPTDIWAWIQKDEDRLEAEGGQKAAIADGWSRFWRAYHRDFEAAEGAISGAIEAAKAQGELHWELLLRHWRLQLWMSNDIKRALPEAVDLLSLATDERVRDVPQRICAFHDLVDCHVRMDAAGYYDDIMANSREVLAQLPKRHQCADCARSHAAIAAAESGRIDEAKSWLAQLAANLTTGDSAWGPDTLGDAYELLGEWDDAEREFSKAVEAARRLKRNDDYFDGQVGIARARAAKGDVDGAVAALREARHTAKYTDMSYDLARLTEVEGHVAAASQEPAAAIEYFTRAASQYLDLSRYRQAALTGLRAADLARAAGQPEPDEALSIAAHAAGYMPPASADIVARLRAYGREPLVPELSRGGGAGFADGADGAPARGKRQSLEAVLASHLHNGNARGVAVALYRLGRWHAEHEEPRAAVDYFVANAILERALHLTMDDREDALQALGYLQKQLPPGTVEAALAAAEHGPSGALARLMGEMAPSRWQWLVRGVRAEVAGKPVVEPEPAAGDGQDGFEDWLDRTAEMGALVVRFRDQSDPAMRERWAASLDETAADIGTQVPEDQGGRELLSLVRGLAALARDGDVERIAATVLPPFNQVIAQIREVAQEPVWRHPGMAPLDFLVEKVAQMVVRSLRIRDEHRRTRLENLAWRLELMNLDLSRPEQLREIARFVDALRALLLADGERLPTVEPALEEPFVGMLAAVWESGKTGEITPLGEA